MVAWRHDFANWKWFAILGVVAPWLYSKFQICEVKRADSETKNGISDLSIVLCCTCLFLMLAKKKANVTIPEVQICHYNEGFQAVHPSIPSNCGWPWFWANKHHQAFCNILHVMRFLSSQILDLLLVLGYRCLFLIYVFFLFYASKNCFLFGCVICGYFFSYFGPKIAPCIMFVYVLNNRHSSTIVWPSDCTCFLKIQFSLNVSQLSKFPVLWCKQFKAQAPHWLHMLKDKGSSESGATLCFPVASKLDLAFYPSSFWWGINVLKTCRKIPCALTASRDQWSLLALICYSSTQHSEMLVVHRYQHTCTAIKVRMWIFFYG